MLSLIALKSVSKSEVFLQVPSGLVFPTAKPRVPAADTASGAAARAVERMVRSCMFKGGQVWGMGKDEKARRTQAKYAGLIRVNARSTMTGGCTEKEGLIGSVRKSGRVKESTKNVSDTESSQQGDE